MTSIAQLLGDKADFLLNFKTPKISKARLHLPGPDVVDRLYAVSDRNNRVLCNLQRIVNHGRLGATGYLSILPVDQGIEHSGGASFAKNPDYFDGENIVRLAIEGGCNAVASTFGVLGAVARKYAHKIPFLVKINHNELMTYPNKFDQIMFGTVKQASDMGAAAVGATIYFGSDQSGRQIVEVAQAFAHAIQAAQQQHRTPPAGKAKQRARDVRHHVAGQRKPLAPPAQSIGAASRPQLQQRRHRLGHAFDEAQRHWSGAKHRGQQDRDQRHHDLRGQVVEQADQSEGDDGAWQAHGDPMGSAPRRTRRRTVNIR